MFNTENWVDFETKVKTFEPERGIYAMIQGERVACLLSC
jgi:hypothetical protein